MSVLMDFYYNMRIYQPIPFPEFSASTPHRVDSEERYNKIKANYGDFKGKTLYDLCSANCFFGFRFLQDGGKEVVAVEMSKPTCDFVNELAKEKELPLHCFHSIESINAPFDIGLYLDTHYNEGTDKYIEHIMSKCEVVFASCAYSHKNEEFRDELKRYKKLVEPIYQGYVQRIIYKCS